MTSWEDETRGTDDPETLEAGGATEGTSGSVGDEGTDLWDATEEPSATAGEGEWRDAGPEAGNTEGSTGDVNEEGGVIDEAVDMTGEGMGEFRERQEGH